MNVMEVFADCSENSTSPAKVAATPPAAAGPALSPAADNAGAAGAEVSAPACVLAARQARC